MTSETDEVATANGGPASYAPAAQPDVIPNGGPPRETRLENSAADADEGDSYPVYSETEPLTGAAGAASNGKPHQVV